MTGFTSNRWPANMFSVRPMPSPFKRMLATVSSPSATKLDVLEITESRLRGEPAAVDPIAFLDPLKVLLVRSKEGIGDQLVPY